MVTWTRRAGTGVPPTLAVLVLVLLGGKGQGLRVDQARGSTSAQLAVTALFSFPLEGVSLDLLPTSVVGRSLGSLSRSRQVQGLKWAGPGPERVDNRVPPSSVELRPPLRQVCNGLSDKASNPLSDRLVTAF